MRSETPGITGDIERLLPWFPFLAALLLRMLILRSFVASPYFVPMGGDRGLYHDAAIAFSEGRTVPGVFTFLPLYPWLLGKAYALAGGPNPAIAGIVQAVLDGLTAMMVFGMANRRYGGTAALLAGSGFALLGAAATYSLVSMPVSLGLFWTALTASISDRWARRWNRLRASAMGLLLGTGGQILGAFWLMIIPFGIWAAFSAPHRGLPQRIIRGALLIVFGYSCLLPTLAHNRITGRRWVPVTAHGGLNLFVGNNQMAKGYGTAMPGARASAEELTSDSIAVASRAAGIALDPVQADRFWRKAALKFWRENPIRALKLLANKAHRLASVRDFDDTGLCRLLPEAFPELKTGFVGFGLVWILACAGLPWRMSRFHNPATWILAGGFVAGILITFVTARYRLPIAILLMPAAAATLTTLPPLFQRGRFAAPSEGGGRAINGALIGKLATAFCGIAIALLPHPLPDARLPDDLNRSAYCLRDGDRAASLLFAERAAAQFPWSDEAWFALGNALLSRGDHAAALEAYEQTLAIAPSRTDAMFNSAAAFEALGKTDEARVLCRRIVDADPANAKAWFMLAVLHRRAGNAEESQIAIARAAEIVGWDHPQVAAFIRSERDPEPENAPEPSVQR